MEFGLWATDINRKWNKTDNLENLILFYPEKYLNKTEQDDF